MAQDQHPLSGDTAEIKSNIERTRVEMGETLGEIQDRLRPDHLMQQARDGVTQAASGKVRHMMNAAGETASAMAARAKSAGTYAADYATAHPLHVALAVGAVTWWMLRGRSQPVEWLGAADTEWDDADVIVYGDRETLRDKVGGYASSARQAVGEYASSARETVGEYASGARETAGEYAESARQSARRASERVRSAASSATASADDWVRQNPMAAGAIALAVGACIGLSVRRTAWEDSTLGGTRDRAWEQAARAARNLTDTVTDKVATAAENLVGESISQAARTPSGPMGRA